MPEKSINPRLFGQKLELYSVNLNQNRGRLTDLLYKVVSHALMETVYMRCSQLHQRIVMALHEQRRSRFVTSPDMYFIVLVRDMTHLQIVFLPFHRGTLSFSALSIWSD